MTEYSPSPSAPASDVREVNRENSILGNFSAPKGVGAAEEYIVNDALLDKAREASRDLGIPESVVQEDPGAARNIVEADRFNQLIRDDGDISQVFGSDPEGGAIMGRDESNVRDFSKAARDALDAHSSPFPEEYMETSAERHARLLQQSMWNQQPFWTRTVGHEAKRAYYNIKEGFHAFNQRVAFESAFKERSETELGLLRAKFHGAEDFNEDEYLENLRKELMVQGLDHRDSQTRTREVKDRILSSPRMNDFFKRSESREGARGWLSDTVDLFSTFYAYPDEFMAVSVNGMVSSAPGLLYGAAGGFLARSSAMAIQEKAKAAFFGSTLGFSLGSYQVESLVAGVEALEHLGLSPEASKEEALEFFSDPGNIQEMKRMQNVKGSTVAAWDIAGMFLLRYAMIPGSKMPSAARKPLNFAIQAAGQVGTETMGEYTGTGLAFGWDHANRGEALVEGFASAGVSLAQYSAYGPLWGARQVSQLYDYRRNRRVALQAAMDDSGSLPDTLGNLRTAYQAMEISKADRRKAQEFSDLKLQGIQTVNVKGSALQSLSEEVLEELKVDQSVLAKSAELGSFVPVKTIDILRGSDDAIRALESIREDIKARIDGRTVREARTELESLNREVFMMTLSDLATQSVKEQKLVMDEISLAVQTVQLAAGRPAQEARDAGDLFARNVLVASQAVKGGGTSVADMYDRMAPRQAVQSVIVDEGSFEAQDQDPDAFYEDAYLPDDADIFPETLDPFDTGEREDPLEHEDEPDTPDLEYGDHISFEDDLEGFAPAAQERAEQERRAREIEDDIHRMVDEEYRNYPPVQAGPPAKQAAAPVRSETVPEPDVVVTEDEHAQRIELRPAVELPPSLGHLQPVVDEMLSRNPNDEFIRNLRDRLSKHGMSFNLRAPHVQETIILELAIEQGIDPAELIPPERREELAKEDIRETVKAVYADSEVERRLEDGTAQVPEQEQALEQEEQVPEQAQAPRDPPHFDTGKALDIRRNAEILQEFMGASVATRDQSQRGTPALFTQVREGVYQLAPRGQGDFYISVSNPLPVSYVPPGQDAVSYARSRGNDGLVFRGRDQGVPVFQLTPIDTSQVMTRDLRRLSPPDDSPPLRLSSQHNLGELQDILSSGTVTNPSIYGVPLNDALDARPDVEFVWRPQLPNRRRGELTRSRPAYRALDDVKLAVVDPSVPREFRKALRDRGIKVRARGPRDTGTDHSLPDSVFQRSGVPRESFGMYLPGIGRMIVLFQEANATTFLHEAAHLLLDTYQELSRLGLLDPQVEQSIKDGLGVGDLRGLRERHHELFARSWEYYLWTARVPEGAPEELARLLQAANSHIRAVYESVRDIPDLPDEVDDEIIAMLDRVMAGMGQADDIAGAGFIMPLSEDEESLELARKGHRDAQAKSVAALMAQVQRDKYELRRRRKPEGTKAALEEVKRDNYLLAQAALTDGVDLRDDSRLALGYKLNSMEVQEILGDQAIRIPEGMQSPEGVSPDIVAEDFGLLSGQDLLNRVMDNSKRTLDGVYQVDSLRKVVARKRKAWFDRRQDTSLLDQDVRVAAMQAVGAQDRSEALAREYDIASGTNEGALVVSNARESQRKAAEDTPFKDMGNEILQLAQSQSRASREAALAFDRGDLAQAALKKEEEIAYHQRAVALDESMRDIMEVQEKLRKWTKDTPPPGVSQEMFELARYLLKNKGVIPGSSEGARELAARKMDQGYRLDIPESVYERKPQGRMTAGEMKDLGTAADSLEREGAKETGQASDELIEKISESIRGKESSVGIPKFWGYAEFRNMVNMFVDLDGRRYDGLALNHIYRPVSEGRVKGELLNSRLAQEAEPLLRLMSREAGFLRRSFNVDGRKYRGSDLVAMAELYLSRPGRELLMNGSRPWMTNRHIETALLNLNADHARIIQMRQGIAEKLRPYIGGAPPQGYTMDIGGVQVQGGTVLFGIERNEGRTYQEQAQERSEDMLSGKYTRMLTHEGAMEAVRENKGKKASLSLTPLWKGLNDATHDIGMRKGAEQAGRILKDRRVQDALEARGGAHLVRSLDEWLKQARAGHGSPETGLGKILRHARVGITVSILGLSMRTLMSQNLGVVQGQAYVGREHLLGAVALNAPWRVISKAQELSDYMKLRRGQHQREALEYARGKIPGQLVPPGMDIMPVRGLAVGIRAQQQASFYLIGQLDLQVSSYVWLAQYNKALKEGVAQQDAVFRADLAVKESQGSASLEDANKWMRGNEFQRLWTLFGTFLAAMTNLVYNAFADTRAHWSEGRRMRAVYHFLSQFFYYVIVQQALMMVLLGEAPEEDESWMKWMLTSMPYNTLGGIPIVRDITSWMHYGFSPDGPMVSRMLVQGGRTVAKGLEGEFDENFWRGVFQVGGPVLKAPGHTYWRGINAINEYNEREIRGGEMILKGLGFKHHDLIRRLEGI